MNIHKPQLFVYLLRYKFRDLCLIQRAVGLSYNKGYGDLTCIFIRISAKKAIRGIGARLAFFLLKKKNLFWFSSSSVSVKASEMRDYLVFLLILNLKPISQRKRRKIVLYMFSSFCCQNKNKYIQSMQTITQIAGVRMINLHLRIGG